MVFSLVIEVNPVRGLPAVNPAFTSLLAGYLLSVSYTAERVEWQRLQW
jgi:hypothetical protein